MTRPLHRKILREMTAGALVLAVSVVVPASLTLAQGARAHASNASTSRTLSGVVVARDVARHALILSTRAHVVETLRLSSAQSVRAVSLGALESAKVSVLGDGTFRVLSLTHRGFAHTATLRATVVQSTSGRLTLSAGGSVFAVASAKSRSHDSSGNAGTSGSAGTSGASLTSGDVVVVSTSINQSGLDETSLQQVGQTNLISLEGVLTSVTTTSLVLSVDEGAPTTITIPASVTLPTSIVAGNAVEVVVDNSSGTFTLVSITDDAAATTSGASGVTSSGDGQSANVEIEGLVVAANATSLTIQPGDQAAQVIVAIPSSVNASTITVGERVHVRADLVAGVLTLTSVDVQTSDGGQGQSMATEVEGVVMSVTSTSIVIQPGDQAAPVTLVVPTTLDVSSVVAGDRVHAQGEIVAGVLTLTSLNVQGPGDGSSTQTVEVDGVVTAVSATNLTVQPSDAAAAVSVAVPATLDVSSIQVGSDINATAVLVAGVLTLSDFAIHAGDASSGSSSSSGSSGSSVVDFNGVVSALSPGSLSLAAGDNSQVATLVVPTSVDLTGVAIGDRVNVSASLIAGVLTVTSLNVRSAGS